MQKSQNYMGFRFSYLYNVPYKTPYAPGDTEMKGDGFRNDKKTIDCL